MLQALQYVSNAGLMGLPCAAVGSDAHLGYGLAKCAAADGRCVCILGVDYHELAGLHRAVCGGRCGVYGKVVFSIEGRIGFGRKALQCVPPYGFCTAQGEVHVDVGAVHFQLLRFGRHKRSVHHVDKQIFTAERDAAGGHGGEVVLFQIIEKLLEEWMQAFVSFGMLQRCVYHCFDDFLVGDGRCAVCLLPFFQCTLGFDALFQAVGDVDKEINSGEFFDGIHRCGGFVHGLLAIVVPVIKTDGLFLAFLQ